MGTNTGIGIGIGIPFKNNALGGDRPYLPPELKARLIGVWDNYGKKNTDADRNIIKNKIPNAGGDLEILNAAYKLNSGFGEYKEDFTSWRIYPNIEVTDNVITTNGNFNSTWFIYKHANENEINEMNIKVSGIPEGGIIRYFYIPDETATIPVSYNISEDGVYHLPKSKLSSNRIIIGFTVSSSYDWNNIRIEQLSDFGGAFVTDGVNDMIISQKTLQEMGVTKDFTVVSMIHQISWRGTTGFSPLTNYIRPTDNIYARNYAGDIGKTGIYGYVIYDVNNTSVNNSRIINTVLGDKKDYSMYTVGNLSQGKFSVQGYIDGNDNIGETSSVAHYWTFALLGKATEDDINLIIAYFNLDRTLKPDICCNIERQGITNDNHADFNDRLIDYSGNGRDIQMYNLAWKGGSGIAAKPFETIKDYTIVSDEARQKLTIYNEFSYKIKSNTPGYYWTVQSIIRDNTSYQVTIITDKDCYWINATSFINSEGNKESIRKRYPVLANTPTQVIICGLDQFEYPEGIEPTKAVSYVNLEYAGEITITFIPSHKGGLLLDGVNDFGKVTGMPIYKDYTFIIDYERISYASSERLVAGVVSKSYVDNQGAFILMAADTEIKLVKQVYSFGGLSTLQIDDFTRALLYQSKYKCGDVNLTISDGVDGDTMWLGTFRDRDSRFFNGAIYSLMSFPYSMSEFLIERQLKKHKLGTLYPDMVKWRPIIKSNVEYASISYLLRIPGQGTVAPVIGQYYPILSTDTSLVVYVATNGGDEVANLTINGQEPTSSSIHVDGRFKFEFPFNNSPQKINITIDEYIRYEDIVQPYPSFVKLENLDRTYTYTWGDKLKVGDTIRYNSSVNLLEGAYTLKGQLDCNGVYVYDNNQYITVAKEMIFAWTNSPIWSIDDNEPKCILSPRLLRIPNSSYKILGYIPDISGHGNHGVIHNSAYAEGSGVNEDGSYQFDGVDDFVTIPTTVGGKQMLMKVNWDKTIADAILYDQGGYPNEFAIYNADNDNSGNPVFAYQARNNGQTYIDGILNKNIKASELRAITHNITITNELQAGVNQSYAVIGSNRVNDAYFTKMALYDFMLFDEISTDDKIKELNTYIGITPKVTLPNYYWDNYGKKNTDANRGHVDEQVSLQKTGTSVNPLENFNISYEGMSGYNGYPVVFGASKTWERLSGVYNYTSNVTNTTIHVTHAEYAGVGLLFSYVKKDGALVNIKEIPAFRVTIGGLEGNSKFGYRYLATEDATEETLVYLGNGTHELAKSFAPTEALLDLTRNSWVGIFITPKIKGEVVFDCDITIEVLPEYENGLAYDGVSDFSQNTEIEVVEDFTFLVKGSLLKELTGSGGCIARKGDKKHYDNGGYAFIYCFDSPIESYRNSYYSFGKSFVPSKEIVAPPLIGYMTKTNVNGETTTFGTNSDIKGIIFGNWSSGYMNMVIYKSIFYTKTISLLEINFLKNLMEKDEIIDINHPIFISNTEDESNTSQDT